MLVVKVEIWPFGDETHARELGRLKVWNDGKGTREYGSYGAHITDNLGLDLKQDKIVTDWPRRMGAMALIGKVFKAFNLPEG